MDESEILMIPFHSHEMDMDRAERANKRLWVIIIVLIVCLIGTNAGWLLYESQFTDETISTEIEAQQDGDYNFVSGGDLNYGANSPNQENSEKASP